MAKHFAEILNIYWGARPRDVNLRIIEHGILERISFLSHLQLLSWSLLREYRYLCVPVLGAWRVYCIFDIKAFLMRTPVACRWLVPIQFSIALTGCLLFQGYGTALSGESPTLEGCQLFPMLMVKSKIPWLWPLLWVAIDLIGMTLTLFGSSMAWVACREIPLWLEWRRAVSEGRYL